MRKGGRYIVEGEKQPKRVEGTEPHPEGSRAREANGAPLDEQGKPVAKRSAEKSTKTPARGADKETTEGRK